MACRRPKAYGQSRAPPTPPCSFLHLTCALTRLSAFSLAVLFPHSINFKERPVSKWPAARHSVSASVRAGMMLHQIDTVQKEETRPQQTQQTRKESIKETSVQKQTIAQMKQQETTKRRRHFPLRQWLNPKIHKERRRARGDGFQVSELKNRKPTCPEGRKQRKGREGER